MIKSKQETASIALLCRERRSLVAKMPINNWNFFRSVSACNDQKSWLSENPQVGYYDDDDDEGVMMVMMLVMVIVMLLMMMNEWSRLATNRSPG